MKIREFYRKHMDFCELTKAYIGIIILTLICCYYSSKLPGLFGEQINTILEVYPNGGLPRA